MRLFTATVAFILLITACGSGDDDVLPVPGADTATSSSSSTTEAPPAAAATTESTESTSSAADEAEEAIPEPSDGEVFDEYIADRVEQYFQVVSRALAEPSPTPEVDYPEFADVAAGAQLELALGAVRDAYNDGVADREPENPSVGTTTDEEVRVSRVQTINESEDELTVFRCSVFDDETYDVETGETKIAGTLTTLSTVTFSKLDGQWMMTFSEATQKIRGVAGCYLASEADFPY